MLVLSRKVGEKLIIGDNIVIQIVEVSGHRVRIGIEAPPHVEVLREELCALPVTGGSSQRPAKG